MTFAQSYLTPSNGYQSSYDAASQLRPDQQPGTMASPLWSAYGYTASNAVVQQEGGSGPWVLSLDNTASSGAAKYSYYHLDSGTGSGTNSDLMTLDFRFRITDTNWLNFNPQLSLGVVRPPTALQAANGQTEHLYYLTFGRYGIQRLNAGGTMSTTNINLGNSWHDARLSINTRLADARLYLDGDTTPVVSFSGGPGADTRNQLLFGDGSSDVVGKANVSALRWTNNNMAIPLVGGQVNILKTTVVDTNVKDVNFTYAHRFTDGTISLSHSVGQHLTPEETSILQVSHDNGQTWQTPSPGTQLPHISSTNLPGGGAAMLSRWDADPSTPHTTWGLMTHKWASSSSTPTQTYGTVTFPFATSYLMMHRSLVELDNGDWVATAYGLDNADPSILSSYVIGSADQGQTWNYLASIGSGAGPGGEGYNESSLVELANGNLLALMRTDNTHPAALMQTKSSDGGLTWSAPIQIADYGVDPAIILLQNGALVASSGRPGMYILVDFSGTGDHWQEVPIYSGVGSSYTSLVELEPNVIGLFYDESGFAGSQLDPALMPNRILMDTIQIQLVPEPATMLLAMAGGLLLMSRRRPV
jgi:hypothetical protein